MMKFLKSILFVVSIGFVVVVSSHAYANESGSVTITAADSANVNANAISDVHHHTDRKHGNTKTLKRKHGKYKQSVGKRAKRFASGSGNLSTLNFDFSYSGDVMGIPNALRQYDSNLQILKPLGNSKNISVNLDLQAVKVEDLSDALSSQTNGQVGLIYSANDDSIRLNFTSKIDVGTDAIKESLKWQDGGGKPRPILKNDGVVRFPYGEYQPVVTCEPLNLCDIELQAGEEIEGIVIGDSQRWNEGDQGIPVVYSGLGNALVPHLVLKPSQGGLDTSLMVTTSRRTYMIKLKSRNDGYVARVGFYYPGELIQKFETNKDKLRNTSSIDTGVATNPDIKMPLINLSKVNYRYTLSGDDYIWKPTQVFDDGTSVYIQLPDGVSARSLPGLCIVPDGAHSDAQCEMVNFRYNDHFYIVDKLFDKAKLINGFGNSAQTITIKRDPDKPGFWARLFGASSKK